MSRPRTGYWATLWAEQRAEGGWTWWIKLNHAGEMLNKFPVSSWSHGVSTAVIWTSS